MLLKIGGEEIDWGFDDLYDFLSQYGIVTGDAGEGMGDELYTMRFSFTDVVSEPSDGKGISYLYFSRSLIDHQKWIIMTINIPNPKCDFHEDVLVALEKYKNYHEAQNTTRTRIQS